MTITDPAAAIQGTMVGPVCSQCNGSINDGEPVTFYATRYDGGGWQVRRVYCKNCDEPEISTPTRDIAEVVGEAIRFRYRLVSVRILDHCLPEDVES